jgi:predicted dienelactone hydrolase
MMKWIRRGLILAVVLMAALVAFAVANALRTTNPVGFQSVRVPDAGGESIQVGVWYPTQARPRPTTLLGLNLMSVAPDGPVAGASLPLIVISHGNGGGPGSHADLALALAESGFVVAAPMHTGDNYADQSAVGSAHWLLDRNRHVHATLEYMLEVWPGHAQINVDRIGMFGFSAGGFTALTAIGGEADLRLIATHCAAAPEFVCRLLSDSNSALMHPESVPPAGAFVRDARIKAAVIAAPGLGFTFVPNGLLNVTARVQLWSGQQDVNVPEATNTGLISQALGARTEFHSVPGARHFSFLVPCGLARPPFLCRDAEGFDRAAFHADMNAQVVTFFRKNL